MKVGIMLPQEWEREHSDPVEAYESMTRVAQEAERLGFASVWVFDHLHSTVVAESREQIIFECWTSTAALARDTQHIGIGQMVTCNSFRHPALLAKMASTVDILSHGRLTLGIGAGWYEPEYRAYGYPFPATLVRLQQFREAIQIIRAMWTEERASFHGKMYQVDGAINEPKGVQQPHIPLLIAGKGEQVTLKLVARYGDACNFTHPSPEELERKFALLRRYCEAIGRDERSIQHTIYVNGFVGETDVEAVAKTTQIPSKFSLEHMRVRGLIGTPETIRRRLRELELLGVQEVIVFLRDCANPQALRLLAQALSV